MQGAAKPHKESSGGFWSRVFGGSSVSKPAVAAPPPAPSGPPPPEPQPGLAPLPRIKPAPGKPAVAPTAAAAAAPAANKAPQASAAPGMAAPAEAATFFMEVSEANRYTIQELIGKGSYGVVCSAIDNTNGQRVAIKKITDVFSHVSDATRILREIMLLRQLKHPDIVEIKHILLPPQPREFKDVYIVFELMETDLHQVIKANDDLTAEHHQFFLYQMLRGLKYVHSANVFHRDLKPKNILANSDCKLKICDFGLARPAFADAPTTVFWTDYVATRWYRAPELCGCFFAKYTKTIDVWSIGCIFAEILSGKPLFPGRNVVHQLELITDLLGTPSADEIAKVRNEKARRFLQQMPAKPPQPLASRFPRASPAALKLLTKLLSFDPALRVTAEEALTDPYFTGLHDPAREPVAEPISRREFEFEKRKLSVEEVRDLIYREALEYHPAAKREFFNTSEAPSGFVFPSAVDNFKRQFAHLEGGGLPAGSPGAVRELRRQAQSLPREQMNAYRHEAGAHLARSDTINTHDPHTGKAVGDATMEDA